MARDKKQFGEIIPFFTRLKTRIKDHRERSRIDNRLRKCKTMEQKAEVVMELLTEMKPDYPHVPEDTPALEWLKIIYKDIQGGRRAKQLFGKRHTREVSKVVFKIQYPNVPEYPVHTPHFLWLQIMIMDFKKKHRVKKLLEGQSRTEVLKAAPYRYCWYFLEDGYRISDNRTNEFVNHELSTKDAELWILERYLCELKGLPKPIGCYEVAETKNGERE
jgi:hypothetical protein